MTSLIKPVTQINYSHLREARASDHINIVGHYNENTLIDKDGRLIKIFKVDGLNYVTQLQINLDVYKMRRNHLFKTFNSNYALYSWTIRSPSMDFPEGKFEDSFADRVNSKYKDSINGMSLFHNQHYLAFVTKAPEGKINRISHWIASLNHKSDKNAKDKYLAKIHIELSQVTNKLLSTLSDYNIKELSTNYKNDVLISEKLSFISRLINLESVDFALLTSDASSMLPQKRLFFNARSGTIEFLQGDGNKKYAAVLSIKNYTNRTYAGLLDNIQKQPIEFILTQSFRFFDAHVAKTTVKHQQMDFRQSTDESYTQTEELSESLDEAASGEVGLGLHHLTVLCISNDKNNLNQSVANLIAIFSKANIVCVREDTVCEATFWAQLPGNFAYIPREATISTKNLAGFVSLHNDAIGKAQGNFWGSAVTLLETISGSPYYFNFHFKDVGNCLCFGTMGSGKTTLIGFLLLQSLKFGGKRIVFDKDRGLEILVRALSGTYEILTPGIPTGFNPCQLQNTPENRSFLNALIKKLLTIHGQPFDENDAEIVNKAITRLYTLPYVDRRLRHIAPYFGTKQRGSLRSRFDEWHSDGAKAWLFDNETDQLNLDANVLGFELGAILNDIECKTPAFMYLMHRVTQSIDGHRGGIFLDEAWRALEDEYFKSVVNDLSRTPHKKNNFLCLSTQAPEDAANTEISKTLNEAAACKIFFPNPSASRATYIGCFGLSEREYELIKTLNNDDHYFLLNFGRGKESVVLRANLNGLEDEIAIISGRESSVKLLDNIRKEVGDDPSVWLPIFHKRRKEIK